MQKTFTTQRLTLRPLILADEPWITKAVQSPEIYRKVARIPAGQTPEQTLAFVRATMDRADSSDEIVCMIEVDGERAGLIGLNRQSANSPYELGYWLHPDFWNKGIATEAAEALLAWADRNAYPKYSVSGYFADNPASGQVLRKLGYLPCWRGPVFCQGRAEKVDHVYMSRLAT